MSSIGMVRFEDDLCADAWVQPDQLGMMKQLDAVDVPEMKL